MLGADVKAVDLMELTGGLTGQVQSSKLAGAEARNRLTGEGEGGV